jgi:AraC-like DNA-binding protein
LYSLSNYGTNSPAMVRAATSIAPQRIGGNHVAEGARFEWPDSLFSTPAEVDCEPPHEAESFGDVECSRIGNLDFTHLRSSGPRVRRMTDRISRDQEDFCLVLVQREGRGTLHQDGRVGVMKPGDFVLNDCTRPYELAFEGDRHDICMLRLPRHLLAVHVPNVEELSAITVSGSSPAGSLLRTMVDTLCDGVSDLPPASAVSVCDAITSVVGAGLRSLPEANRRKPSKLTAYHLARIRAYVQEHLRDPELSIRAVADGVQLSPDHICRLFRNEPVPLSRLIWQQRLEACQRDLADPRFANLSVSDVAFSWGFKDAAHFSRSFRERFGTSPRDWRAASHHVGRG